MHEPDAKIDEIARRVIGAAIEVHRTLGPGFLESAYEEALAIELSHCGLRYERQHRFLLMYRGQPIGEGKIDFFVEDELVVEIKAIVALGDQQKAQTISYLKAKQKPLGLLINFNVPVLKDGIKRVVCTRN